MYLYPWMLQGDRKGWTRQTNPPPPAPPHQPAVKQLRSPCLFVEKSHQPCSWRCGQKDKEIAVNLWVIENTYIPLCHHLYLRFESHNPYFSVEPTFWTSTLQMEPLAHPVLSLPLDWIDANEWVPVCCLEERWPTCAVCSLSPASHLSPVAGIDAPPLFPLCPGGICGKIGGPLRCLMAFIDSHKTIQPSI